MRALACALLIVTAGCEVLTGAGERPEGTRQIRLKIPEELTRALGNQVTGVQLAGVVVNGQEYTVRTSPGIDPATETDLIAYMPGDESPVLIVQTLAAGGANAAGHLIARIEFSDGSAMVSRIPRGEADLDLGTPTYQGDPGDPSDSVLQVEEARDPLALIDTDQDGASDLIDTDDDGDTIEDSADDDRDGDGIIDLNQMLGSLIDDDENGVPDVLE